MSGYKPMAVAEVVDSEATQNLDLKSRWCRMVRSEEDANNQDDDGETKPEITEDDISGNNYEEENFFKFLNELQEQQTESIQFVINKAKETVDKIMAPEFKPKKEERKPSIAPPSPKKGGGKSADKKGKGKGKGAPEPEPVVVVSTPALTD